jgi:uncharacterized protein
VSVFLLDVNVLLALSWPSHRAHDKAQGWFEKNAHQGWATCPLTQTAFIRLSSNVSFSSAAITPQQAGSLLEISLGNPHHQFWPDELNVFDAIAAFKQNITGHQQITDAYLLGLTIFHKGKLATLDGGISSLIPERQRTKYIEQL